MEGGPADPRLHVNRLEAWPDLQPLAPELKETARRALRAGRAARAASPEDEPVESPSGPGGSEGDEISITCLTLEEMSALNRDYLGRPGPTDVIAFDLGEEEPSVAGRSVLGDIYVAPDMASRAAESGEATSLREEMLRLVAHGVLHVLGFTHPELEDRWESRMYRVQEQVVEDVIGESRTGGEDRDG